MFRLFLLCICTVPLFSQTPEGFIRVNLLGYKPSETKQAVCYLLSSEASPQFVLISSLTHDTVSGDISVQKLPDCPPFDGVLKLTLPEKLQVGSYRIRGGAMVSPAFQVSEGVYTGITDKLLYYLRQQQCGYNPAVQDSCHTKDGFIIYHDLLDSTSIDVTGGWHDASDYLRYATTSATTVYQLALAWQLAPEVFSDSFDENGNSGANGIADVVDQVLWGTQWLMKMNPNDTLFFHQVADDRDHRGFRLPNDDTISYGTKPGRPVYTVRPFAQGIFANKNRSTGNASVLAKFASAFAITSTIIKKTSPQLSQTLLLKAINAYQRAKESPGVQQTAPCRSPYFYEEASFTDDLLLAASELYLATGISEYRKEAIRLFRNEPVTGWMGKDTAAHYEYYPFLNAAAYRFASSIVKDLGMDYIAKCMDTVIFRGNYSPAGIGIPFIWCSNNLLSSWLSLCRMYQHIRAGDRGWDPKTSYYREYEGFYRNWLFGMNPWGTSMVTGIPLHGDYPSDTHSAYDQFTPHLLLGALMDGPVYRSIYTSLKGVYLKNGDEYEQVQPQRFVYHDDYADYSTNEPTLDGTASLLLYLAQLERSRERNMVTYTHGAITRGDTTRKNIYLIFSGDAYSEGLDTILSTLQETGTPAAFFFTGAFYRNPKISASLKRAITAGHYLGAHSDAHLLYAPWENRDSLLVDEQTFLTDLKKNYQAMNDIGIATEHARYFLPPYEWYNDSISVWAARAGVQVINFTGGTGTNADYTVPSMGNKYRSSSEILERLFAMEAQSISGLNGALMLLHAGSDPLRTDKFYFALSSMITNLQQAGYSFKSLYHLQSDINPIKTQTRK